MLHSIDDQPCLTLTEGKPFAEIKDPFAGCEPYSSFRGADGDESLADEDPMKFAVWARFHHVHRDEGFAWFLRDEGTNISYVRYWAKEGWTRNFCDGHSDASVFVSYSGLAQDCTGWTTPAKFPLLKPIPLAEWPRWDIEKLAPRPPRGIAHRLDGPAEIRVCLGENEREQQPEEDIDYDPYYGPFPKERWYIRDFPLKREEHKIAIKWLVDQPLSDEEHSTMVYLLLHGFPLDSEGDVRIGFNARSYPG